MPRIPRNHPWQSEVKGDLAPVLADYSLAAALADAVSGKFTGLEGEVHQEMAKSCKLMASNGFLIPLVALARPAAKAMTAGTATAGGFTVGEQIVTVADALRPASVAMQLGAQMVNLGPNAKVPGISTGATAFWLAETEVCPESNISTRSRNGGAKD
jgi:HK97 family phage major capsid protein